MSGTRRWLVPIAAMLVLAATACSKGGGGIGTTLSEYQIELSSESASAGEVTFDITNNGEKVHEFLVLKTDLAADALPNRATDAKVQVYGNARYCVDAMERDFSNTVKTSDMEFFNDDISGIGSPGGAAQVGPTDKDHPIVAAWPAAG